MSSISRCRAPDRIIPVPPMAELYRDPVVFMAPGPVHVRTAIGKPVGHDVDELVAVR